MSLPFHCTSCTSPITPTSPRISCNTCLSHFCASCYILSRSPAPHLASHPALLYEYSGYLPRNPPQLPPRPPLQPVSTTASTQRRPVSTQLPLLSPSLKQVGGEGTPPQRYPPQPSVSAFTTTSPSASPNAASPQTRHILPASEIPSSASPQANYSAPYVSTNAASPEAGPSRSSPYAYSLRSSSTPGPQTPQYTYAPSSEPVPAQPQQQQRQQQPPQQPPQTRHSPPASEIPSSASSQTNHTAQSVSTNAASPEAGPLRSSPYAYTSRSSSTPGPQTPQYTYAPSPEPVPDQPQQQQRQQQPPQQPPRPQPQQTHSTALTGWQPFYNNTAPTAFGAAFFNEVFNHLDTNLTGLLLPEQYSAFLDVVGYSLEQNVWKNQMSKSVFGYNPQDFADYSLREVYINLSTDHVMAPRPPSAPNTDIRNSFSSLRNMVSPVMSKIMDSIPTGNSISGNQMPLLTRRGFIDIIASDFLYYPNAGFGCLTKAARHYQIWPELGDIPRNVMPAVAPQELIDRVKLVNIEATRRAEELLAAKTAQARIEERGRRQALNLIGGSQWVEYY